MEMPELLTEALERGASDVHLVVGQRPIYRINTELIPADFPEVTAEDAAKVVRDMVGTRRYAQFLRR